MICRHAPGDPNCGSTVGGYQWHENERAAEESRRYAEARAEREKYEMSPQPDDAEIIDMVRIGPHVVVKARYKSCKKCAYEGVKIMVYLGVTEMQLAKWRELDPHFADPAAVSKRAARQAPAPAARFPASKEGWEDALAYAAVKAHVSTAPVTGTRSAATVGRYVDTLEGNRG